MKFAKPPTSFQEQVDLLKSRGVIINDSEKALQNISRGKQGDGRPCEN